MQLSIGISCYPTFGGSGVVATELGKQLAHLGHEVHFITYDVPQRLGEEFTENIYYHAVDVPRYPLFAYPPYSVALSNKMAEVARYAHLDIIHAHYAVPHATSAFLARELIKPWCVKIVTTLHGTDITLVGKDPSYLPITRFSIERSDAVTAVSSWLRRQTIRQFNIKKHIEVVPNFVDPDRFTPDRHKACEKGLSDGRKILMHVSNFRSVKRVMDLLEIFTYVRLQADAKLILIGDGPERARLEAAVRSRSWCGDVVFLGNYSAIEDLLPCADSLLMPSASESFGLAALEAMSCAVPVICTNAGGLPELVEHGISGFCFEVGDTGAMAEAALNIIGNSELRKTMGAAARRTAVERFPTADVCARYVDIYERLILRSGYTG